MLPNGNKRRKILLPRLSNETQRIDVELVVRPRRFDVEQCVDIWHKQHGVLGDVGAFQSQFYEKSSQNKFGE